MGISPHAVADIRIALEALYEAYGQGDLDGLMAAYATEVEQVNIGTGVDERLVGRAELRAAYERDMDQSSARQMTITWFNAGGRGDVAWAAVELDVRVTTPEGEIASPARATYVLLLDDGAWRIAQSHTSVAWGEQEEGQSFVGA